MNEPIEIELIPDDEPEDGEGIISADALFATLMEGFQHSADWHSGVGTVRYAQFIDGERIGPIEVTKAEYTQLQGDLRAREQQSEVVSETSEQAQEEAA